MRSLPNNRRLHRGAGFTLIEMLIIAPIVLLVIAGFIALMVNMVGDALVARSSNQMTYEIQNSLNQIEQDTHLSTQFLTTTKTLDTPQGSNNNFTGNAAFTNDDSLIFGELATTKNPLNTSRQLVYYAKQPNDCGATEAYNRPLITKTIYFIKDGTLWRRQVLPRYNLNATVDDFTVCEQPWQRDTCSPGYTISPPCETNDTELMHNVTNFSVQYYNEPGDTTPIDPSDALDASTIKVTLSGKQTTAGKDISATESLRVTKLNDIDVELPPPTQPVLNHTFVVPDVIKFAWSAASNATSYKISYQINGGSWTNQTVNSQVTSTEINTLSRGDTIVFKVVAHNASGDSDAATDAVTVPLWTNLTLQNNWEAYGGNYTGPQFTKTKSGLVFLRGLLRNGTVSPGTVIATLPDGYRPSGKLYFQVAGAHASGGYGGNNNATVIGVFENGDISIVTSPPDSGGYLSISGIQFLPSTTTYQWHEPTLSNDWHQPTGTAEHAHYTTDSEGHVILQGRLLPGDQGVVNMASIPSSYIPSGTLHFLGGYANAVPFQVNTYGNISKRTDTHESYFTLNSLFMPASYNSWKSVPKQNGWARYGTGYPDLEVTKTSDHVVVMEGLIKPGTTGSTVDVGTVPAGYRPDGTLIFTGVSHNHFYRIDIYADGTIRARGTEDWASLNLAYIVD